MHEFFEYRVKSKGRLKCSLKNMANVAIISIAHSILRFVMWGAFIRLSSVKPAQDMSCWSGLPESHRLTSNNSLS